MQKIISQRGQRFQFDVVVIGSGIAGLSYLAELLAIRPQIKAALITKATLTASNSYYAQGGIAASQSPQDVQAHINDTLAAGDGLCDLEAVSSVLKQSQNAIQFLINQGVSFDSNKENKFSLTKEAGHSTNRIYHCTDQTGAAIISALEKKIAHNPALTVFERHTSLSLITQVAMHVPGSFPEVRGVYVLDELTGLIHTFLASIIVLATGGAGKIYRYTSNSNLATGDGVAMAYRAGARVGGLEFYQFHPTLLYHPKINNFLISEALRGEGAYLRLPETDERFMERYSEAKELATRDVVARAIFCEIEKSNIDFVYLDIRHKEKSWIEKRFPGIYQNLLTVGLDLSRDLIPVVPAAHYMGGGIVTDIHGRTDLKRLFAIGETAFSGLHGANRLASNSLLEAVVMACNAAKASIDLIDYATFSCPLTSDWDSTSVVDLRRASEINSHWRGLRGEMSSYAGIVRTETGLRDLLQLVLVRREMIEEYYWKYAVTRDLIELRNIILVAELIVRFALNRKESRGGHYRDDFKQRKIKTNESISKPNEYSRTNIRELF